MEASTYLASENERKSCTLNHKNRRCCISVIVNNIQMDGPLLIKHSLFGPKALKINSSNFLTIFMQH